jgi:hypothetical protein
MKPIFAAAILVCATAPFATAQPDPDAPDGTTTTGDGTTTDTPTPPRDPAADQPVAMAPQPMQPAMDAPAGPRPDGFSVGIGLGYDLPTTLQQPNITSVRVRLATGLTFEPLLAIGTSATSQDDGNGMTVTNRQTEISAAVNVRVPRKVHDRVDLVLVGAAGLGITNTNPEGDNNDTSTRALALSWGLGLDYWVGHHWAISLTGTNPLISYQWTSQQTPTGTSDPSQSTTSIGLIWNPNVTLMVHLFL